MRWTCCILAMLAATTAARSATTQPSRTLSGVIVDPSGLPVSRAQVAPLNVDLWKGAVTDADGRFTINNVPADAKYLLAKSQTMQRITVISLADAPPQNGRYVLGSVIVQAFGLVLDPNGKAVKSAKVFLHITGPGGISYDDPDPAETEANGAYGLGQIPGGDGFAMRVSLADGTASGEIPCGPGASIDLPDLVQNTPTTRPTALAAPAMAEYSGKVVDESGNPIAGASLSFFDFGGVMSHDFGIANTDSHGAWHRRLLADLPKLEIRVSHPDYSGWQYDLNQATPPIAALLDGSAVQVMKHGVRISGRVCDPAGKPVAAAVIAAAKYGSSISDEGPIEDCTCARSTADGSFSIGGLPPGDNRLLVYVDGYPTQFISLKVAAPMLPVQITLVPGTAVSGRVIDENGKPLPKIRVSAGDWFLPSGDRERLASTTKTDDSGRFTLGNLPGLGSVHLYFAGKGRMSESKDTAPGVVDLGDIVLYPPPTLAGHVVDDATGQPVNHFKVSVGMVEDAGRYWWLNLDGQSEEKDGRFSRHIRNLIVDIAQRDRFVAHIIAPGYATMVTPSIQLGDHSPPLEIRLKRLAALTGTLLLPDGRPAGGADVYWVEPNNQVGIAAHSIDQNYTYAPDNHLVCGDDGAFTLPAEQQQGLFLVLHKSGYALLSTADVTPGQTIRLNAWSRIEGTYRPAGKARAGATVYACAFPANRDPQTATHLSFDLSTTTDAQGRFALDYVPSIPLRVGVFGKHWPLAAKNIQPDPGSTVSLVLADDGPAVRGQLDLSSIIAANPPTPGTKFDTSTSWVRAVRVDPPPQPPADVETADWQKQIQAVMDASATGTLTLPATFADLQPDGSFAFDALAAGKYVLLVEIHGERPLNTCGWGLMLGKTHAQFGVGREPLTIPTIPVPATLHPGAGGAAPPLAAATIDGKTFNLADHRGQYVVLDFWAGWCAPCRAEQPAVKTIYAKFAAQVCFAGLNFDYTPDTARAAAEQVAAPWPQLSTGPWDASNPTLVAYGVQVIPSLWLIDPQGNVVARDLTPEELTAMLQERVR
jgi:thiol-disulfide isomerase/thioredoxin